MSQQTHHASRGQQRTSLQRWTPAGLASGRLMSSMNTFSFLFSLAPYTKPASHIICACTFFLLLWTYHWVLKNTPGSHIPGACTFFFCCGLFIGCLGEKNLEVTYHVPVLFFFLLWTYCTVLMNWKSHTRYFTYQVPFFSFSPPPSPIYYHHGWLGIKTTTTKFPPNTWNFERLILSPSSFLPSYNFCSCCCFIICS